MTSAEVVRCIRAQRHAPAGQIRDHTQRRVPFTMAIGGGHPRVDHQAGAILQRHVAEIGELRGASDAFLKQLGIGIGRRLVRVTRPSVATKVHGGIARIIWRGTGAILRPSCDSRTRRARCHRREVLVRQQPVRPLGGARPRRTPCSMSKRSLRRCTESATTSAPQLFRWNRRPADFRIHRANRGAIRVKAASVVWRIARKG